MKSVIHLFASIVRRMPVAAVVVVVSLTAVFGALAQEAEVSQGNEGFAPDNPEILAAERLGDMFGGSGEEVVQLLVRSEAGDVISAAGVQAVLAAQQAIASGPAAAELSVRADRPPIVSFLAPVEQAIAQQGMDPATLTDGMVKEMFGQALAQMPPEQAGFITGLLSDQAEVEAARAPAGLVLVFLQVPDSGDADQDFDRLISLESEMAADIRGLDVPGVTIEPFSFALLFENQDAFQNEIGRLFGLAALIILVILAFVFWLKPRGAASRWSSIRRTGADTLLTLLTIIMAITWMQGIGVLLQRWGIIDAFSPPTQIVPVLLIGLGVDYGIHLTARYREELAEGAEVVGGARRAIGTVGVALALATVTTVVGFLTNVFNPVPALKDFGILAAVGIVSAFVLMLIFVPSVRTLVDRRAERGERLPRQAMEAGSDRVLPRLMEKTSLLAEHFPIPTLALTVALGVLGFYGLTQLSTEFSITDFVAEDDPAVATLEVIQEEFGGGFGETSQVLVEGDLGTVETHNALVEAVANLVDTTNVQTFGGFANAESVVSVMGGLLQPDLQTGQPADPALAGALLQAGLQPDLTVAPGTDVPALYGMVAGAAPDAFARVLHPDGAGGYDAAQVAIQTQAGEAGAAQLRTDLVADFAPVTDAGLSAIPTSQTIITAVIIQALSDSQVSSLIITLVVAGLVLVINFWIENRRPGLGLITIAPVGLVVLWTFGMMAATGIPFGPVTATLAALAIGIGVPFTIHIARRFEEDRARFDDIDDAIRSTTRHTGGALAGSAFTTMAGFGILVTSSLTPFQQMGLVTVYAVGFALIASVLVLPSMLALWERWHRNRGHAPVEQATVAVD